MLGLVIALVAVAVVLLAAGSAFAYVRSTRDRIVKVYLRGRFVVTLKTGEAFEGILLDADNSMFVLGDATAHSVDGPAHVDGKVYLERANVAFMQMVSVSAGPVIAP